MNTSSKRLTAVALISLGLLAPSLMPATAEASTFSYQYSWTASTGYSEFTLGDFTLDYDSAELVFQSDGNLVLYDNGRAVWQSRTYGKNAAKISFQSDGNIVIYRADDSSVWASGFSRRPAPGSWVLALSAGETRPFVSELNSTTSSKTYWRVP